MRPQPTSSLKNLFSVLLILFFVQSSFGSETLKGAKKDMEAFKTEMSARLEKVEKQLTELKSKSKAKGNDVKNKTVSELEDARDKIKSDMKNLSKATDSNWQKVKSGIADAFESLNTKVQKALKE